MIQVLECTRTLPFYQPIPLTNLPLIYHPEHLFPYTSYGDTAPTPVERLFRMVRVENEFLRVEIAPELGGRIYSIFDKRIGQEILFSNPVVKPVRILPIWGFISGGMEFNFPIAHSPTSIATVGCATGQVGDYGYIRVGEREARTGMEWVVEIGLVAGSPVVVQRTALRNKTGQDHPWMMWTITALRSTQGTEFVHPPHRVLVHDDRIVELDWPGDGLNWDRNARQMTAYFWKPGSAPEFGAFHHDLGFGLMHVADPEKLPGKKIWTYGHGRHRHWSQGSTTDGLAYLEIESGPLLDQSEKPLFRNGEERHYEEFWIPVHNPAACDDIKSLFEKSGATTTALRGRADSSRNTATNYVAVAPGMTSLTVSNLKLPPMTDPWLGWQHSTWQTEWEHFRTGAGPLPASCVPTGLELEAALRGARNATEPLALWLAFRGQTAAALELVEKNPSATAQRIAGLILWKSEHQAARAVAHLEAGPLHDPVAVMELDELYAELGLTPQRMTLLAGAPAHRLVIQRRAALALAMGNAPLCLSLLTQTTWPREHQHYVRSDLWKAAKTALGEVNSPPPDSLNEDNLAKFGAYWSD